VSTKKPVRLEGTGFWDNGSVSAKRAKHSLRGDKHACEGVAISLLKDAPAITLPVPRYDKCIGAIF